LALKIQTPSNPDPVFEELLGAKDVFCTVNRGDEDRKDWSPAGSSYARHQCAVRGGDRPDAGDLGEPKWIASALERPRRARRKK
jgi:hypothetical protein